MAITNYSGLSTAVYRRLNRAAETAVFDDCILLAEAEVNRRLALSPVRPMHNRETATLSTAYIAVPSGILDVDSFTIGDDPVTFTAPQNMQAMASQSPDEGQPRYYTQIGTEFRFYPAPDTDYTLTLTAWHKVPNLNSTDTTNWLLTAHPDVYFHGVLAHACQEYFDEEGAGLQAGLFDGAIQKVLDAYPSRPDTRPLRVEADMLVPSRFSIL